MAEYIERQKVFDSLPTVVEDKTITLYGAVADFMVLVSAIPAADVVEVKHGWWMNDGMGDMLTIWKCSLCGYRQQGAFMRYCPNCGARMDGAT